MKKVVLLMVLLLMTLVLFRCDKACLVYECIGLAIDRIGITRNTYNICVDDEIKPYVYIYWTGENGTNDVDRLLLYHQTFRQEIPNNSYGKNRIVIKTKTDSILYDKIGILKLYAFSKHSYEIELSTNDTLLIVNWNIDNWYSRKTSKTDTVICKILP